VLRPGSEAVNLSNCLRCIGRALARYLNGPLTVDNSTFATEPELQDTLKPGDVLLVEGDRRISVAIKYLTQSTWSHAALYVGDVRNQGGPDPLCFVEADLTEGVRLVAPSEFRQRRTRICRPVGLTPTDTERIVQYALSRLGHRYDLRNIFDLARYLLPTPPVPTRVRRRMLALGSGDPTRAICSTLIAQAFETVRYPVLPTVETVSESRPDCIDCTSEVYHIRHHSLYAPRDFDLSPYFEIVKPRLASSFQYDKLRWSNDAVLAPAEPRISASM